ncbi:unnamed protein product, partial [Rotaria sordida]
LFESNLQEIVKEILIKQCESPYIVKYIGSYFEDVDL